MLRHMLPVLVLTFLALVVPLLTASSAGYAAPLADIDASLALDNAAPALKRAEWVDVALELVGEPVYKTYLAQKAQGASKADAAKAQKARQDQLKQAQKPVVAAVHAPHAQIYFQHQTLVNAVTMSVRRGDVAALRTIPGVIHIYSMPTYDLPDLSQSVRYINAERVRTELGITGRGVRVGIIDSGLDYTHRNFGGPGTVDASNVALSNPSAITETVTITNTNGMTVTTAMFPTDKVAGGYDYVGQVWRNTGDPIIPDPDPIDSDIITSQGHGSHVAGIAAGFGVPNTSFNGSLPADADFAGDAIFHGVAPAATLYAYRVCNGACPGVSQVAAYEAASDPNGDGDLSDHLDAVNESIGGAFGSGGPGITTAAVTAAVEAGIAVSLSAGNNSDVPYIHGGPAIAPKAVSTANIFPSGQFINRGVIDEPAPLTGQDFVALQQVWAQPLSASGPISAEVVYIGRGCPANTVPGQPAEDAYLADPRGKIALIPQTTGHCAHAARAQRAAQNGAVAVIIFGSAASDTPVGFSSGGFSSPVPTVTVSNRTGVLLRDTADVHVTLSDSNPISIAGFISGSSSRGPALISTALKPDISAPGENIVSTGAGTGDGPGTLSGTSMAAPHIAGTFALVKQAHPTWSSQEIEAVVVNTANPIITEFFGVSGSRTVSVTRQGSGLVDAYRAVETTTIAHVPDSVASLSFGFNSVVDSATNSRSFELTNKGTTARTYNLSYAFQDATSAPAGTTVAINPASVTLAAGETRTIQVTLTIAAAGLPPYTLRGSGSTNTANLLPSEIGGFIRVAEQGGAGDALSVPFYALARRASAITSSPNAVTLTGFGMEDAGQVHLNNTAAYTGTAEVFSYFGDDPEEPNRADFGDLRYVGLRTGSVTSGSTTRPVVDLGVQTWGPRTLAIETEFDLYIDTDRDGEFDYVGFNADPNVLSGLSAGGVNNTYVLNLTTGGLALGGYTVNFTTNNASMILRFNASALGLGDLSQPFDFYVETSNNFSWTNYLADDRVPSTGVFTYSPQAPRFRSNDADGSLSLAPQASADLSVYANARGFLGGDMAGHGYDKGLLILYPDNTTGAREADVLTLGLPYNFRVEQQTFTANADLSGFVVNRLGGLDRNFGSGLLWTGVDNRAIDPTIYHGVTSFSLGAAGSSVEFDEATLEITGADASYMNPALDSRWYVDMLSSSVDAGLGRATFNMIANAASDARLEPILSDSDLGVGTTNAFVLNSTARSKLDNHARTSGRVTFRTSATPQYSQNVHLFAWDSHPGATGKLPILRALTITQIP